MLWLILGLVIIGLFLIYLEFFVPGGIPVSFGILLLISSVFLFHYTVQIPSYTLAFLAVLIGAGIGACVLALRNIRATGKYNTVYLSKDQEGFQASGFEKEYVGMDGVAVTPLCQSGYVSIDGKKFQALSSGKYINKGDSIKVIGGRGAYLLVTTLRGGE